MGDVELVVEPMRRKHGGDAQLTLPSRGRGYDGMQRQAGRLGIQGSSRWKGEVAGLWCDSVLVCEGRGNGERCGAVSPDAG